MEAILEPLLTQRAVCTCDLAVLAKICDLVETPTICDLVDRENVRVAGVKVDTFGVLLGARG